MLDLRRKILEKIDKRKLLVMDIPDFFRVFCDVAEFANDELREEIEARDRNWLFSIIKGPQITLLIEHGKCEM